MPSSASDKNIVIVGGGSTGSCAVIALAQAFAALPPPRGTTLHLFDPDGFGNGGIAYGQSGRALLNETADAMSPWNPGAFVAWADDHGYGADPKAFHERRVFGRFLHDECEQAR
ncbi:MAG TPA: FAD/NAD(P)-binding protein, partial [Patescibacteria group bacterium]|nr:FAD/NAD(P)-binding protein [Patescibacteria group bacterium]